MSLQYGGGPTFKPGDRLLEADLGERFKVSRSPVREALFALENEGTAVMVPYKGAIVKPLSPQEVLDIGELRLAVIALVAKPAHHCLSIHLWGSILPSAYRFHEKACKF